VTTAKGLRTRETILDAAELLFADHGFDGVTIRDIGKQAKLLTGLITYHFPTKDILFEEVVRRRAKELNDLRRKMLKTRSDHDTRQVLLALARPYLDKILSGDEGWRNYARLGAHLANDQRWADLSDHLFGDVARLLIRALRKAEPRLTAEAATRAYVHSVAVMISVYSSTYLIDRFSKGRLHSDDIEASFEPMIEFLLGGIEAYCNPDFARKSNDIKSAKLS
jgi:AcrR family transcriptional regulator